MFKRQNTARMDWGMVAIATTLMLLMSVVTLYPATTPENILIALRISSITTAVPFLLLFVARPITVMAKELSQWLQANRSPLWLILTISHLIHLYQIWLYYQLGNSCPLFTWLVTAPLWIIMIVVSIIECTNPQALDTIKQNQSWSLPGLGYGISIGYIWLIFTVTFALNTAEQHLLLYNAPGLILYLSGAVLYGVVWWQKRFLPSA